MLSFVLNHKSCELRCVRPGALALEYRPQVLVYYLLVVVYGASGKDDS